MSEALERLRLTEIGIGSSRVLDGQPELESNLECRTHVLDPSAIAEIESRDPPHPQRSGDVLESDLAREIDALVRPLDRLLRPPTQCVECGGTTVCEHQRRISSILEERDGVRTYLARALGVSVAPERTTEVHHRQSGSTLSPLARRSGIASSYAVTLSEPAERLQGIADPHEHTRALGFVGDEAESTAIGRLRRGNVETHRAVARQHQEARQARLDLGSLRSRRAIELEGLVVVVDEDLGVILEAVCATSSAQLAAARCFSARGERGICW